MGNSSSRPNTPGANNSPQNDSPSSAPKRKPPKRKESIGGLTNKGVAAAPTASLESDVGRSSQPSAQGDASSSRGRAQTLPTHIKDEHVRSSDGKSASSSISATRSKSPRPPLNVDTSSPAPSELEPVTRSVSSNQSITSDSPTPFYGPHSQFGRAPRLPLPIEEEVLSPGSPAPGSPVLEPTAAEDKAGDKGVHRSRSTISATTLDDDGDDDDEIYRADEVKGPLVDTLIEWKEGGDKVYVTGTFCDWAKKSRLHRNGPSKDLNAFSAIISLPPGTIFLAFLVDGIAMTARHMPTTVDFANSLVNYLVVPYQSTPQPVIPKDAHRTMHQDKKLEYTTSPPAPEMRPATATETQAASASTATPIRTPSRRQAQPTTTSAQSESKPMRKKTKPDDKEYHTEIPDYLLHWDEQDQSSKVRRANAVSSTHQPPPQLPPYLQKSVLSIATAFKDDASVLAMPNHTVINHLATSSIKDNVLGTSATTRYKKKFVTTIMYMPTSASGQ